MPERRINDTVIFTKIILLYIFIISVLVYQKSTKTFGLIWVQKGMAICLWSWGFSIPTSVFRNKYVKFLVNFRHWHGPFLSKGRLPVKWTAYEALMYGTYTAQSDVWVLSRMDLFEVEQGGAGVAGMAQWWERSPPTNVARVRFPVSASYVGWVCCWFLSLLREVFLRVLRFSPLLKKQHF